jgi:hypothetical protein
MANIGKNPGRAARWLCPFARLWGTLAAAVWLVVWVLAGVSGDAPWTAESSVLATLIIASVLGVIVGWWRAGFGGMLLVIAAVAHAIFAYLTAEHNQGLSILVTGGPFLVAGALFLLCWRTSQRDKASGT